ncbi:sciellin isoform X3 [Ranitomeya imitator]|uniref:sciellin isoform X3 n=1 Tax=Ranitomeya imitator TaxID=111125 RepID=UPI0037E97E2E
MSTFSFNKSGNDAKSNTLGSMNRQNVIQETNKKRTLLKDGSWIKKRPEEEEEKIRDENYGKSVLNRYKSQEDLDSAMDKEEKKPIHNRFRSDDALDRIPSRNTYEGGNKAATLERFPMSGPEDTNKRQSWAPSNKTTTTTITEESKRKSWTAPNRNNTNTTTTTTTETRQVVPGKPEGQKITIYSSDTRTTEKQPRAAFVDSARSRFEKTDEKPSPPTSPRIQNVDEKPNLPPRSPIAKTDERPSYPSKPVISETGERRSPMERKQRSQDIDNLIEISTSKVPSNKSTQDVDNLIDIKPTTDKAKKREQLDDFIEISNTAKNFKKKDDNLDNLIEIKKPDVKTRSQDLDDLVSIGGDINKGKTKPASTNLTNQSSTTTTTYNVREETNDLPNRRSTTTTTYNVKEEAGDGPKRSSTTTTTYNVREETNDLPNRRSTTTTTYNVKEEAGDGPKRSSTTTATYNVKEESNNAPNTRSSTTTSYNIMEGPNDVPSRRSTTTSKVTDYQDVPNRRSTTSSSYKVTDDTYDVPSRRTTTSYRDNTDGPNSRSNVTVTHETSYSSLPNSSYGDVSRNASSNSYGPNIVSNSIKTVYSTSDRSVMEKDMCTYCRKPLGIDAKMILKDMNICCHATCFKCEACSGTLENLKAGDSMWIYKQTIHCEPCYFAAREKWII